MKKLTNEHRDVDQFFKWREDVLKKQPMSKLEKSMEKFFNENKIKYHRCFPIRIGNMHRRRYAVTFWCNKHRLVFDLYDKDDDMSVYEHGRRVNVLFYPKVPAPTIIPIPSDMAWRDVKKQLKLFFRL